MNISPVPAAVKKKQTMAPFLLREVECWVWQLLLFLTDGNNASCQFRWRGKSGAKKRHSAVRAGEKKGFLLLAAAPPLRVVWDDFFSEVGWWALCRNGSKG